MGAKDLKMSIAATFLTGPGLEVSKRIAEEMLKDAMKTGDASAAVPLAKIWDDLRKLADRDGAS